MKLLIFIIFLLSSTYSTADHNHDFIETIDHTHEVNLVRRDPIEFEHWNHNLIADIFTLRTKLDESTNPITIVHMPAFSSEYEYFIHDFLHMSRRAYENLLMSKVSTGHSAYVKYAATSEEVVRMISSTPSSIGYIDNYIYVNTGNENVQVMETQDCD
jgi:ABC-type phosphate transport system substrate-binding protein